jgi:hypothetical protein
MIVVLVPMAPPGLVVAAFAVVSVVVVPIVIALRGGRRLSGRLRDDRRRRGHNGPFHR